MIEIPEAITITKQINETLIGKKITHAIADYSPHKFTWYHGNPEEYTEILDGATIEKANQYGGMIQIQLDSAVLLFCDGVNLIYNQEQDNVPVKHQLLVEFEDSTSLTASVRMYGGIWCFKTEEDFDNPYYKIAKDKISPLSKEFNEIYFEQLLSSINQQKLSTKAFLATEQRIPGLGNGVLQDILWNAKINPRTKLSNLSKEQKNDLYQSIKYILSDMTEKGGRDTEKDLFGNSGGYKTVMSKMNIENFCPRCGRFIRKENYLGGSIYYCDGCQGL